MLLKDDLLWMAGQFSMTVAKSKKKETVAQMVAEYLLAHPKDVLTLIPSNELKMLREMVKLEPGCYLSFSRLGRGRSAGFLVLPE